MHVPNSGYLAIVWRLCMAAFGHEAVFVHESDSRARTPEHEVLQTNRVANRGNLIEHPSYPHERSSVDSEASTKRPGERLAAHIGGALE